MTQLEPVLEGVWRATALHPEWCEDEDGWEPEVAWHAVATADGLVSHGPLVLGDGAEALADALSAM